jgi:hypothetical protein
LTNGTATESAAIGIAASQTRKETIAV